MASGGVLDFIKEWRAPFSPPDVVEEAVTWLTRYRTHVVTADAYAAGWVEQAFRRHGISYRHSEQNRSELFLSLLPLLTSGNAVLLDHPRLIGQISQLERRTGRSGRDIIDHMNGAHDDLAVAAAGALTRAAARSSRPAWEPRYGEPSLPNTANFDHRGKPHSRRPLKHGGRADAYVPGNGAPPWRQ